MQPDTSLTGQVVVENAGGTDGVGCADNTEWHATNLRTKQNSNDQRTAGGREGHHWGLEDRAEETGSISATTGMLANIANHKHMSEEQIVSKEAHTQARAMERTASAGRLCGGGRAVPAPCWSSRAATTRGRGRGATDLCAAASQTPVGHG